MVKIDFCSVGKKELVFEILLLLYVIFSSSKTRNWRTHEPFHMALEMSHTEGGLKHGTMSCFS